MNWRKRLVALCGGLLLLAAGSSVARPAAVNAAPELPTVAAGAASPDFDGDGKVDSRKADGSYTYTQDGSYRATLTVTDQGGRRASADVDTIRAYLASGGDTEFERGSTGSLRSLVLRGRLQQTRVDPELRETEQSLWAKYEKSEKKKKGGK